MVNKNKFKVVSVILVAVLMVVAVHFSFFGKRDNEYSVVYLSNSEVYIGKLTNFPRLSIDDAYLLQVVKDPSDPSKNNFQLNPIKDTLWAPKHLYINRDQVIFYGPLEEGSKIMETIKTNK